MAQISVVLPRIMNMQKLAKRGEFLRALRNALQLQPVRIFAERKDFKPPAEPGTDRRVVAVDAMIVHYPAPPAKNQSLHRDKLGGGDLCADSRVVQNHLTTDARSVGS